MANGRKAIPWIFKTNPLMKSWSWNSDHFDATIMGSPGSPVATWRVVDKSGSTPTQIGMGEDDTFLAAQDSVLELVSKSYPTKCGYTAYAGDLATTFNIKNGKRVDLSTYVGSQVIVEAFNKKDPSRNTILMGTLSVSHFNVELKTDQNRVLVIPPAFIINIKKEFDSSEMSERKEKLGVQRLFKEEWRRGCTGSPGYITKTVIHNPNDEFCSIHDK